MIHDILIPNHSYAFVDGSFNPETGIYGCGVIFVDQRGNRSVFSLCGSQFAKMRNVAGEIMGAEAAVDEAIRLGMKKLTIFHDYEGIAYWATGRWKCNNPRTIAYAKKMKELYHSGKLRVFFQHVKAHAGILENEEADRLAKEAVGLR